MTLAPAQIGKRISYFRKRAGLSQLDLETAIGASSGSISRIEHGQVNPTKETLLKIALELKLGILELEYLTGMLVDPATDNEISAAKAELGELFNREDVVAYLVDDRRRLIYVSNGFINFTDIPTRAISQFIGKSILRAAFDPRSPMIAVLDPANQDQLADNMLIRIFLENEFMQDDLIFQDTLNFIAETPWLAKKWKALQDKTNPRMIVHLSDKRMVKFIKDGKTYTCVYSVESLQRYPRFQVADYVVVSVE